MVCVVKKKSRPRSGNFEDGGGLTVERKTQIVCPPIFYHKDYFFASVYLKFFERSGDYGCFTEGCGAHDRRHDA